FRVAVNGEALAPVLHEYAWSGGTDVTSRLLDLGIPLFTWNMEGFEKLAQLPEAALAELKRDDLVWEEQPAEVGWLVPKWEYQTVYEWTQVFTPGETVVEIFYRPLFGAGNDYFSYYEGGE